MDRSVESLYCRPKTHITPYVNYAGIKIECFLNRCPHEPRVHYLLVGPSAAEWRVFHRTNSAPEAALKEHSRWLYPCAVVMGGLYSL